LSQPFHVAEIFSGKAGKFVTLEETISGFGALLEGQGDEYAEAAFYMVGNVEEAFEQGKKMAAEFGAKDK
jgi:F-type H+-transporting ATPase subunit beta